MLFRRSSIVHSILRRSIVFIVDFEQMFFNLAMDHYQILLLILSTFKLINFY